MKKAGRIISIFLLCVATLFLILDSKIAVSGAQRGLELCIQTVIPSLFPFMIVSTILTSMLSGCKIPILKRVSRFCKMTPGTENLLLVGLIGGYPVGAKSIYDSWKSGQISRDDARRYLGFCSNAGPAFIFGMCSNLFQNHIDIWALWGIHISSAILVGHMLKKDGNTMAKAIQNGSISLLDALKNTISAVSCVCGWVVLFRVIIAFLERWFLWSLSAQWQAACVGILELTNGCVALMPLGSDGAKLLLCAIFLGFGGLCVALQTISVVGELGTGMYFPGKILQCIISGCVAGLYASLKYHVCSPAVALIPIIIFTAIVIAKKTVAFPRRPVYNGVNNRKGEIKCCSVRKLQNPAAIVLEEQKSTKSRSYASKKVLYLQTANAANSYMIPVNESPLNLKQ